MYRILKKLDIKYGDTYQLLMGYGWGQYWSENRVWTKNDPLSMKSMLRAIEEGSIRAKDER